MTGLLSSLGLDDVGFHTLWPLYMLPLALLPLLLRGYQAFAYPATARLPDDPLSRWLEYGWRGLGALAIGAIILTLAGPYRSEQQIEKVGHGAHIMVVFDRSGSMNDGFANNSGTNSISKMKAARDVLAAFVRKGSEDLIGMVTFSTSPILAVPLGSDLKIVQAALEATEAGGEGFTAVARGLGMALDYFEGKPLTGSRAILLVSDGGAHLDGKTQDMLRAMFTRQHASLYWIYLRSSNGASLKQAPSEAEGIAAYPEYALHQYFQTLGVDYHVYEAENPQAVQTAMADIARLKNKPTRYLEAVATTDLAWIFYWIAWLCGAALLALHMTEVKQWRAT